MRHGEPIRVIHTADLHLGMENYGRWNSRAGMHGRLEDYLSSLDQVVDYAMAREADLFLVAGDIFKSRHPAPTPQREFARRVKRLLDGGVRVALLVGNHDQPNRHGDASSLDIYGSLDLPGVTLFHRPALALIETRRGPVQVAGVPHLPRSFLHGAMGDVAASGHVEALEEIVLALAQAAAPEIPALLTAHLSVEGAAMGSEKDLMVGMGPALSVSALSLSPFAYVALGHIHKPQALGAAPPLVYPGSLDCIDFGEERDEKGFVVVELERGRCAWRRERIRTRPFKTLRVDLSDGPDATATLLAAIAATPVEGAVVRLSYRIQASRAHEINEEAVRSALEGAFDVAWRPEVIHEEARARHPELTEALSGRPLAALERYLALKPELAPLNERLLAGARALVEQEGAA